VLVDFTVVVRKKYLLGNRRENLSSQMDGRMFVPEMWKLACCIGKLQGMFFDVLVA